MFYGEGFESDGRRAMPATRKTWEPKALNSLHLRILQLKAGGAKSVQIAEICGCTPTTVNNVVNSDLGKRKLRAFHAMADLDAIDWQKDLDRNGKMGVVTMRKALEGEIELSAKDLVSTAIAAIDRAGYSPKNLHLHAHQHQHFTPDEIAQIRKEAAQRARESGCLADETIDAEVVEK